MSEFRCCIKSMQVRKGGTSQQDAENIKRLLMALNSFWMCDTSKSRAAIGIPFVCLTDLASKFHDDAKLDFVSGQYPSDKQSYGLFRAVVNELRENEESGKADQGEGYRNISVNRR